MSLRQFEAAAERFYYRSHLLDNEGGQGFSEAYIQAIHDSFMSASGLTFLPEEVLPVSEVRGLVSCYDDWGMFIEDFRIALPERYFEDFHQRGKDFYLEAQRVYLGHKLEEYGVGVCLCCGAPPDGEAFRF